MIVLFHEVVIDLYWVVVAGLSLRNVITALYVILPSDKARYQRKIKKAVCVHTKHICGGNRFMIIENILCFFGLSSGGI